MEEKNPTHISYKEYQKKVNKNPSDGIAIFASAFFILLLLFLGIAKQISPDIDVAIGEDETKSTIGIEKNSVDERLKLLQMEDNGQTNAEDGMFSSELDEKVVIPEQKEDKIETVDKTEKTEKTKTENIEKNDDKIDKLVARLEREATPKPSETASPEPKVLIQQQPQNIPSKVVVGYYATKEQAEVAKGIIAEAGLGISPFVRSIGGAYTIQVGSYSTREKAQTVVNDLLRNNYPARIINE